MENVMDLPLRWQFQLECGLTLSYYLQDFETPESLEVELLGGSHRGDVPAV